jgi:hypothetical protein
MKGRARRWESALREVLAHTEMGSSCKTISPGRSFPLPLVPCRRNAPTCPMRPNPLRVPGSASCRCPPGLQIFSDRPAELKAVGLSIRSSTCFSTLDRTREGPPDACRELAERTLRRHEEATSRASSIASSRPGLVERRAIRGATGASHALHLNRQGTGARKAGQSPPPSQGLRPPHPRAPSRIDDLAELERVDRRLAPRKRGPRASASGACRRSDPLVPRCMDPRSSRRPRPARTGLRRGPPGRHFLRPSCSQAALATAHRELGNPGSVERRRRASTRSRSRPRRAPRIRGHGRLAGGRGAAALEGLPITDQGRLRRVEGLRSTARRRGLQGP